MLAKKIELFTAKLKHYLWQKKNTCSNYTKLNFKKYSNCGIQTNKCAFPLNMNLNWKLIMVKKIQIAYKLEIL